MDYFVNEVLLYIVTLFLGMVAFPVIVWTFLKSPGVSHPPYAVTDEEPSCSQQ